LDRSRRSSEECTEDLVQQAREPRRIIEEIGDRAQQVAEQVHVHDPRTVKLIRGLSDAGVCNGTEEDPGATRLKRLD
jgi:hypothetical protein